MVPGSDQDEDIFRIYSCYSVLDLGPYYHECYVDSEYSEPVLVVDYGSAVNTDTEVVNIEQRQHKDTDNMS